jgi:hypothetical protein
MAAGVPARARNRGDLPAHPMAVHAVYNLGVVLLGR